MRLDADQRPRAEGDVGEALVDRRRGDDRRGGVMRCGCDDSRGSRARPVHRLTQDRPRLHDRRQDGTWDAETREDLAIPDRVCEREESRRRGVGPLACHHAGEPEGEVVGKQQDAISLLQPAVVDIDHQLIARHGGERALSCPPPELVLADAQRGILHHRVRA